MNWGHKITIVIVLFLAAMLSMVYFAFRQTNEMIDDNYYQKELEFQDVIDAQQNLINITTNNIVHQDMDEVFILLPAGTYENLEQGTFELLRNDSKSKDKMLTFQQNGSDRRSIFKDSISKGMYKARVKWSSNHVAYYKEETVMVE